MALLPGFQEELISPQLQADDWQGAVRQVGEMLVTGKYVRPDYIEAVIDREKICSTGLPTRPIGVAIPHADSQYVNRTGIAVGVYPEPVLFQTMGSPYLETEAAIVFMIAMREPEKQVEVLKGLTELFRNGDLLQRIHAAASSVEIAGLLNSRS
jgi:PTS system galactitol-specific IIA component